MSEKRKWILKVYDDVGCVGLSLQPVWYAVLCQKGRLRPIGGWVESADPSEEHRPQDPS